MIVKVCKALNSAAVVWAASMAYSHRSTTNNMAEYGGLIHGLRGAKTHSFTPLTVVGDSYMIILQNKSQRPPKNERLRGLYQKARRVADALGVMQWRHHYREFNKMADRAANQAIDSQHSQQALTSAGRFYHRPPRAPAWGLPTVDH